MSTAGHVWAAIVLMAVVTLGLRALPFMASHWLRRHALVHKLGETLPLSIMVLLTVDSAMGHARGNAAGLWQELLAIVVVVLLQWRTRQTLLSIAAGTAFYVALRNF